MVFLVCIKNHGIPRISCMPLIISVFLHVFLAFIIFLGFLQGAVAAATRTSTDPAGVFQNQEKQEMLGNLRLNKKELRAYKK